MKWRLFFFFGIFLFCGYFCQRPAAAAADTSRITARVDKAEVTIGEPVRLTCSGNMLKSQTLEWPRTIEGLKGLTIVNSGLKQGFPLFSQKSFKGWYLLKGYEPGEFEIPSFNIRILGSNGVERTLETEKITITIKSLVQGDVEKLDIKDIKGVYKPFPWKAALGLALLIASLAGWLFLNHSRKRGQTILDEPPVPSHVVALEKIKALEQKGLISRGLVAEFYFELSMIARQYLETRFSLRAPEMTTEEFLASLRESQALSPDHKSLLKEFLSRCDMVKFAKYGPGTDEIHASVASAKRLIQETIPQ